MSRLLSSFNKRNTPSVLPKIDTEDISICRTDYEYNDTSINDDVYTIVTPSDRVYIVESRYSLQDLADWDSKYAVSQRKITPRGSSFTLPHDAGHYKVVDIITLGDRWTIGAKQFRKCQPRLARDKYSIWALQPGVNTIPVKDVIIIERFCHGLVGGPKYKAVVPKKDWPERKHDFEFERSEKIGVSGDSEFHKSLLNSSTDTRGALTGLPSSSSPSLPPASSRKPSISKARTSSALISVKGGKRAAS